MSGLRREEFDAIEFDAAFTGDHDGAAARMSRLAMRGSRDDGSMSRAEAFLRVGEQWLLAGDPVAAANGFRMALEQGGPDFAAARVPLARALFQQGKLEQAQEEVAKLRESGSADPRVCELVAELFLEQSDLPAALDWATAGVRAALDAADPAPAAGPEPAAALDAGLRALLGLRYRIRNDLRLPEDDYDKMLDA